VSRTTVRTQLQSVFAKTETRRQADLMRVLQVCLSLPLRTDQAPLPAVAGGQVQALRAPSVSVARIG
jgi:hypothetical protein